ncbi:hypothetical protein F5Y16DRAFT_373380 [Xylariaceae sp. FL0255]|nr:hypothetical protein F5Y16DRAFT_373380 [Xylariaceae sp. FL0255]
MLASSSGASAGLDTLPTRPPTPPRESQARNRHPLASHITLQTPPGHSPDSAPSTKTGRKKVEFTVHAEYRDPPTYQGKENAHKQSTPVSAPSSIGVERPLKSILKPTSSPNPPNPLDPSSAHLEPHENISLATMLESTIRHLAGSDRANKIDAYTMLVRSLKISNNLPDRIALQTKMTLFTQFIQRDVSTPQEPSLVNHALTLLTTFLHFPAIASTIAPDFGVFIVDHCIKIFEDESAPKEVVRHLMQLLALQDFPPKVMTSDRVSKLISALHNLENHMKGKSIIMSRILVYRRLVRQSKLHMATHTDWLLDLFTDMLSTMPQIRDAAIALGMEASFTLTKEKQLTKKVMEILHMTADEKRYIEFYMERLIDMTKAKSEMAAVPQIWSVVVLMLRCPLDRWEFYNPWLEIIQLCFNSGDVPTKTEANYAWGRLVYALHLHDSSFHKMAPTLCKPFVSQLKRKGRPLDEYRKVVLGSLCNLYYYAFKPNSSSTDIEYYWDNCVQTLIRTLAFPESTAKSSERAQLQSAEAVTQATIILHGLFDSSTVRLWKEDRIAESALARPDQLPALDPKWIRRNSPRVFAVVEPIILKGLLDLADARSNQSKLWKSLVAAVASAAAKEVKVSTDTATFLGQALSLLMRFWSDGLGEVAASSPETQERFLRAAETYLSTMISALGHLPFTEKLLTMNKQNVLIPIATPSHRQGKGHGLTRSPLHHLFSILSALPPGISDGEAFSHLTQTVFEPFVPTRSLRAKRDFVQELTRLLNTEGPSPYGPWVFIADILSTSSELNQSSVSTTDSSSQPPVGHEFREMVKHLERGVSSTPQLPWDRWLAFFNSVVAQATEVSGEAGCAVAVVESLAKAILENFPAHLTSISSNILRYGVCLVSAAKQPRDRQALDAARQRLWGTSVAGSRSASFDPFDYLYRLAIRLLEISYTNFDQVDDDSLVPFLKEASNFLSRCNNILVFKSLALLQHGLGLWIQDLEGRFSSKNRPAVNEAVEELWDRICTLFADATLENFQLDAIEELLCCAFKSKHRHIVNNAVLLWNRGFEQADSIEYPGLLKEVLLSMRPYVDIVLPGLDTSMYESSAPGPSFVESQDDLELPSASANSVNHTVSRVEGISSSKGSKGSATPTPDPTPSIGRLKPDSARSKSSTKSAKRNKTPKLRHDDSQIQFAAIDERSPSNYAAESQVLTDRQKEVRDRQLENAVLFPSIRSSPRLQKDKSNNNSRQPTPQDNAQGATPKANRSYDYVSSTPTPRRGHASLIEEDHEMTDDIPSSPPEPRRNLLPEMQSHSRGTSILDDMPISSSPISGSPIVRPSRAARREKEILEARSSAFIEESLNRAVAKATPSTTPNRNQDQAKTAPNGQPQTPSALVAPKPQETARLDNDNYMDAVDSPVHPAPATTLAPHHGEEDEVVDYQGDVSFAMSDGEERSMARLVIELDSRRCDPLPDYDTSSPEKPNVKEATEECITVNTGSDQPRRRSIKGQTSHSSPMIPSTPLEPDESQSSGKSRRKRKRISDRKQRNIGKRRRHSPAEDEEEVESSQLPPLPQTEHEQPADIDMDVDEKTHKATANGSIDDENRQGSPDLGHNISSDLDDEGSMAAVNLQLITEASQQSEAGRVEEKYEVDEEKDSADGSGSAMERIMASLKDGLEGLRTATLSRDEVYKIEDMFMDIKKELYAAESRSRR